MPADIHRIDDQVSIGAQPTLIQILRHSNAGLRSVLNLRQDEERGQTISPAQEGAKVREFGLSYARLPVPIGAITPELIAAFGRELHRLPAPKLVHDSDGQRAAFLVLATLGKEHGWYLEDALERAGEGGFEFGDPAYEAKLAELLGHRPEEEDGAAA